ncbi:MAG TPA: aminopeptidase P family protein [Mycobacteriales bacterium]|nr:aminopeptidase P family protein [Mycobacteriales bacterium]
MSEHEGVKTSSHDQGLPERLAESMRSGWADTEDRDVTAAEYAPFHARRRQALGERFAGDTLVVPTGGLKVRANDTDYEFRPGSDFYWLTGSHEPDEVLVLRPDGSAALYLHPRSPRDTDEFFRDRVYGELWVGRRPTLAGTAALLAVETAHIRDLAKALAELDPETTRVLRGIDATVDAAVGVADDGLRDGELAAVLAELRLVKDSWERGRLRLAVAATAEGFEDVVRALPADREVSERLVDGVFGLRARHDGNAVGYSTIAAAGAHACTLHWIRNDGRVRPGDLLLLDAGVEDTHLYTADVTRTLPVNGRFSDVQRRVYDLVFAAQEAGIAAVRPGVPFRAAHDAAMRVIAEGLAEWGILPVSAEESLEPGCGLHRRWTLHSTSHSLGLDVHDCARARATAYLEGTLAEGHVLTVEPGLYFQADDLTVPEEYRGIGVRIEDDILVTADGRENLSAALPRRSDEVEAWMADLRKAGPRLPG